MRKFKRRQRHSLPFGLFLAVVGEGCKRLPVLLALLIVAGAVVGTQNAFSQATDDSTAARRASLIGGGVVVRTEDAFSQATDDSVAAIRARYEDYVLGGGRAFASAPGLSLTAGNNLSGGTVASGPAGAGGGLLAPDAVSTWTGGAGSGLWNVAGNWAGGVPGNGDTEVFNAAAANGQFSIDLNGNRTTAGMTFSSTGTTGFTFGNHGVAAIFVLNGGLTNNNANDQTFASELDVRIQNPITFNAASGGFIFDSTVSLRDNLTLAGSGDQTFNGLLTNFGGNRTITNNSTGSITFSDIHLSDNNTGRTLTINGTGDADVSGVISNGGTGAGNLVYSGSGFLTLEGANTYTGTTTVSGGGTLLVNNAAGSGTGTGAVTVTGSGTTLGGTGTISGTVSVGAGANIAPGNGGNDASILTTGALTMAATSNFRIDINGTTVGTGYDQVHVATGGVTITGSILVVTVSTTLSNGQMFTILDKTAAGAITGTFAGIPQGGTVVGSDGSVFTVSYTGGDGNDIVLTVVAAVPEPSTWMGGALAIAGLAFMQRRRLRKLMARRCAVGS